MKLDINEKGIRTLTSTKEELKCHNCKGEGENIFFCEVRKKVFCSKCIFGLNTSGCGCSSEHLDYKIDNKVIENET